MRIYMQIPGIENKMPRFYQLLLEKDLLGGWTLIKEWGQQGAGGRIKRDFFESYEQAEKALIESRDAQIQKGYRVVFVQGQREG